VAVVRLTDVDRIRLCCTMALLEESDLKEFVGHLRQLMKQYRGSPLVLTILLSWRVRLDKEFEPQLAFEERLRFVVHRMCCCAFL
jgi:hypothetical protein